MNIGSSQKKNRFLPKQRQIILAVAISLAAGITGYGQQTIIAQDNFNYANGASLAGQNGGTRWTASWVNDYLSGDSLAISSSGLTYPDLTTGGSAIWSGASGNGISEDSRYLPMQASGLVYVQFLCQFGTQSGGGTPNLRFTDSLTNLVFGIGANGGTYGQEISILTPNLNAAANGLQTATNSVLSGLNLVVTLVDYNNNTISLWVNPNLTNFIYSAPPPADAVAMMSSAPDFNNVSMVERQGSIGDVEIMTIPEPATVSLLSAGLAFLAWRRYRIR
jgi:hypothetical protein